MRAVPSSVRSAIRTSGSIPYAQHRRRPREAARRVQCGGQLADRARRERDPSSALHAAGTDPTCPNGSR